jgi:hypothetical protein
VTACAPLGVDTLDPLGNKLHRPFVRTQLRIQRSTHNPQSILDMTNTAAMAASSTDFADVWKKLPCELQLQCFRYAFPSDQSFGYHSFNKTKMNQTFLPFESGTKQPSTSMQLRIAEVRAFETDVLPLLTCSETRGLVPEAFYTQNAFRMHIFPGASTSCALYPPVEVGRAMRRVRIEIQCLLYAFDTLKLLAAAASKLSNLHALESGFTGCDASPEELEVLEPIAFQTRQLCVTYKHSTTATAAKE